MKLRTTLFASTVLALGLPSVAAAQSRAPGYSDTPPNPFASNYPSAPPPRVIIERREPRGYRGRPPAEEFDDPDEPPPPRRIPR